MNRKETERSVEGPDQKIAPEVHAAVDQDPSEVRPRKMAREESQCDNVAQYKISNIPVLIRSLVPLLKLYNQNTLKTGNDLVKKLTTENE
jgi:hypothetical protein